MSRISLALAAAAVATVPLTAQVRPVIRPVAPTLTREVPASAFAGLRYRNVGPARGGRVTTVTGVEQQPLTYYMGPTGGGVWKTTNAGATWFNVTDKYFNVGSMGDMDVANSDPNILYAGTGSDGYRSNVAIGRGVWKSSDAGVTWAHVGLASVGNIGGVRIHPSNPSIAFVAAIGNPFKPNADRGVYRTTDGGRTWFTRPCGVPSASHGRSFPAHAKVDSTSRQMAAPPGRRCRRGSLESSSARPISP